MREREREIPKLLSDRLRLTDPAKSFLSPHKSRQNERQRNTFRTRSAVEIIESRIKRSSQGKKLRYALKKEKDIIKKNHLPFNYGS